MKKIEKTITVSAQEIECLSHNINASFQKISGGKNRDNRRCNTEKPERQNKRSAHLYLEISIIALLTRNFKKTEGKEAFIDTYYYLVTLIKTLQINKSKDQNQEKVKTRR